jgi:hypothetical protein
MGLTLAALSITARSFKLVLENTVLVSVSLATRGLGVFTEAPGWFSASHQVEPALPVLVRLNGLRRAKSSI